MNNFNKNRFFNFGKYDYIINKSFYRNMMLIAIFGCIGITLLGFFMRWTMCHPFITENGGISNFSSASLEELGYINPADASGTCMMIFGFTGIMMTIFAGYTFHNLRTRQGRIIELTIPATNLERWTWHVLVSFAGGFIACLAGILCADAINAILNLIIYQGHVNSSLTAGIWSIFTFASSDSNGSLAINGVYASMDEVGIRCYLICLMIISLFCNSAIYVFGNSIKYHYNIILTYIVENVISFAFTMILMISSFSIIGNIDTTNATENDAANVVKIFLAIVLVIFAIIAILCYWGSYKKYCKAQITSKWNI